MGYGTQNAAGSQFQSTFNGNPYTAQGAAAYQGGLQNSGGASGTGSGAALPGYNTAPAPTSGQGSYGLVPGTIDIPPSLWQQTTSAIPALGNTAQLTNNIMSELQGDINPQALKNMQDAAAAYGVSSGMPGSNAIPGTLAFNKNLRNIGLDTQAIQHQGAQDYNSLLGAISGLQTPQSLAAEIAAHNAQLKSAPDPTAAAQQQLANYLAGLNAARGLGGGTGGFRPSGGTGNFSPAFSPSDYGFGFGSLGGAGTSPNRSSSGQAGYFPDPLYPGTEIPGSTNLSSILGPQNDLYSPDANYLDYIDQSASPDFSGYDQAFTNPEDYYAGILSGY